MGIVKTWMRADLRARPCFHITTPSTPPLTPDALTVAPTMLALASIPTSDPSAV